MFHNRQNQNSDVIKTPADIDRLVADMNRLQVPKDLQLMPMQRFIQKTVDLLSFRPGLHKEVLDFIEIKYEAFPKQAREITLLLDDVEITPGLTGIAGNLYGNVDDGISHNHTPAKYVTQIWIRSLIASDCFDLLAYYFTSQHATAEQLKNYIFECITKLQAINLDVVLVNTKLKSNFWELSELLGIGPQKQTFKVENKEVVFIFDAPHMMCVTRNNLQKHYLKMDGGTTSWEHIKTFFVKESGSGQKKTPLTAVHIEPHKFDRITPSLAIDVLSNTVYTEMKSYVESGKLPEEALATVQCITLFDRLFDVLNSKYAVAINEYASGYKGTKWQKEYLEKAMKCLEALKVVGTKGEDKTGEVKFTKAWLTTIRGTMKVWEIIKEKDHPYLLTRHMNTEPLDAFFKAPRVFNRNPINPSEYFHYYFASFLRTYFSMKLNLVKNTDAEEYARVVYKRIPAVRHNLDTPLQRMEQRPTSWEFLVIKSRLQAVCDELGLNRIPIWFD